jgi:hypothetical protein
MLVYFGQLSFLLGNKPLTYLMIAYLAAEIVAITSVYTIYKMRKEKDIISHLLNIPGALLFGFLFLVVAFYVGQAIDEIPQTPRGQSEAPMQPFLDYWIPISINYFAVFVAMFVEIRQMKEIKQINFLEREFRLQILIVFGVLMVGLFLTPTYLINPVLPVICMGFVRLGLEFYSERKHVQLKRAITDQISKFR